MLKYFTLVNVLDKICEEAPQEFASYKPNPEDIEKLNQARSKAFIHLFLKVKCGVTSFKERHEIITDGEHDGGIDAYSFDKERKKLLIIQSKFRTTPKNFEAKQITADDLVKMEINNILKGDSKDTNGVEYNDKIKEFQRKWSDISDQAKYEYVVIILGNISRYNDQQIRKLIDNTKFEIFNFERTYNELVFPLCSGVYYDPKEITVTIDLFEKTEPVLEQKISTSFGDFQVRVIFVPIREIGRVLLKYKNSILKYNPRNYLGLSNKFNRKIRDSILNSTSNDFAILNNGITVIADFFNISKSTGVVNRGQIIMTNPQIINGGQTAYTICKIYEDNMYNPEGLNRTFSNKEVMLKIVIVGSEIEPNIKFIQEISNATNQQTRVEEADRRSNDEIQILLQKLIFENFGYFYERKKGEFYYGSGSGYINKDLIIKSHEFLRSYLAFSGFPSTARRSSSDTLFKEDNFRTVLTNVSNDFRKMLLSYLIFKYLSKIEEDETNWGLGLRYGKMAIIASIGIDPIDDRFISTLDDMNKVIKEKVDNARSKWLEFEKWIKENPINSVYFYKESFDFDFYYKSITLNSNIKEFFGNQN
jgi:hypothetical protein